MQQRIPEFVRDHAVPQDFRLRRPDEHGREHVDLGVPQFRQCAERGLFPVPSDVADEPADRPGRFTAFEQNVAGFLQMVFPLLYVRTEGFMEPLIRPLQQREESAPQNRIFKIFR